MGIRIDRRRLPLLIASSAFPLGVAGLLSFADGRAALESVLVACSRAFVLFGERLSTGSVTAILLLALFASGAVYAAAGFFADAFKTATLERRAKEGAEKVAYRGSRILLTKRLPYLAWTAGIVAPRIYVASEAWHRLGRQERRALVTHEMAHVAHRDVLKRLGADVLRRLFWFIPTMGEAATILRHGQEVRADFAAKNAVGRRALAGLYLASSEPGPAHAAGFAFATPRLAEVLGGSAPSARLSWTKLLISILMGIGILVGGWVGTTSAAYEDAPATCDLIESLAPQSFTPLVGPIELYTPAPPGACVEKVSC